MLGLILRTTLIVAFAAALGLTNAVCLRQQPWAPDPVVLDKHKVWVEQTAIPVEQFRSEAETGSAVIVDCRHREEYAKGHLDAPLIINIEPGNVTAADAEMLRRTGLPIILYCSSELCDLAEQVYHELEPYGLTDVHVYHAGWDGILANKLATRSGPEETLRQEAGQPDESAIMPAGAETPSEGSTNQTPSAENSGSP